MADTTTIEFEGEILSREQQEKIVQPIRDLVLSLKKQVQGVRGGGDGGGGATVGGRADEPVVKGGQKPSPLSRIKSTLDKHNINRRGLTSAAFQDTPLANLAGDLAADAWNMGLDAYRNRKAKKVGDESGEELPDNVVSMADWKDRMNPLQAEEDKSEEERAEGGRWKKLGKSQESMPVRNAKELVKLLKKEKGLLGGGGGGGNETIVDDLLIARYLPKIIARALPLLGAALTGPVGLGIMAALAAGGLAWLSTKNNKKWTAQGASVYGPGQDMRTEEEKALAAEERPPADSWRSGNWIRDFLGMPRRPGDPGGTKDGSDVDLAAAFLRKKEGYREDPYWDVNAQRAGYGSDTTTLASGEVVPIREGMKVTKEDSERDLLRRIQEEFKPRIIEQVGEKAYNALSPKAQAALISLGYNYGRLPANVARTVRAGGNTEQIAKEIQLRRKDNQGVNYTRRLEEAAMVREGGGANLQWQVGRPGEPGSLEGDEARDHILARRQARYQDRVASGSVPTVSREEQALRQLEASSVTPVDEEDAEFLRERGLWEEDAKQVRRAGGLKPGETGKVVGRMEGGEVVQAERVVDPATYEGTFDWAGRPENHPRYGQTEEDMMARYARLFPGGRGRIQGKKAVRHAKMKGKMRAAGVTEGTFEEEKLITPSRPTGGDTLSRAAGSLDDRQLDAAEAPASPPVAIAMGGDTINKSDSTTALINPTTLNSDPILAASEQIIA